MDARLLVDVKGYKERDVFRNHKNRKVFLIGYESRSIPLADIKGIKRCSAICTYVILRGDETHNNSHLSPRPDLRLKVLGSEEHVSAYLLALRATKRMR